MFPILVYKDDVTKRPFGAIRVDKEKFNKMVGSVSPFLKSNLSFQKFSELSNMGM
jgi:hypothetical protein